MAAITPSQRLQRSVLLGPSAICKAAATQVKRPEEVWMLHQRKEVRVSYVHEVLDRGGDERLAQMWLLRQPDDVRESYIEHVLESDDGTLG